MRAAMIFLSQPIHILRGLMLGRCGKLVGKMLGMNTMAQYSRLASDIAEIQRLVRPSILNRWHLHDNLLTCRKRNRDIHYIPCPSVEYARVLYDAVLKWEKDYVTS